MATYQGPETKEVFKYIDQKSGQPLFNTALSFVRMNKWPLDVYSLFRNLEEAWDFIGNADNPCYPGQIISTSNEDGKTGTALPNSTADGKYRLYVVTKDETKPNGLGLREFSGTEDAWRIINLISTYQDGSESSTRILNSDSSSGVLTFAPGNENLSFEWDTDSSLKNILRISSSDFKVETTNEPETKFWITGVRQVLDSSITTNVFDPCIYVTENPGEMVIPTVDSSVANIDQAYIQNSSVTNETVENSSITNSYVTNSSIDNGYVTNERVDNASISNASITNTEISNANISNSYVENETVVNSSVSKSYIIDSEILNSSVSNEIVQNSSVTNSYVVNSSIENSSVTNQSVINSSITNSYIEESTVVNEYVTNSTVENSSVTNQSVTNSSITNSYIEESTVVNEYVTNSSIENASISYAYVTDVSIVNQTVENSSITNQYVENQEVTNLDVTNASINYIYALDISIGDYSLKQIAEQGPSFYLGISEAYYPAEANPKVTIENPNDSMTTEYYIKSMKFDSSTLQWSDIPNSSVQYVVGTYTYEAPGILDYLNSSYTVVETENLECVRRVNLDDSSAWYGDIIQSLWPIFVFADANKIMYDNLTVGIALFNDKGRCSNIVAIKLIPKCAGMLDDYTYDYTIKPIIY